MADRFAATLRTAREVGVGVLGAHAADVDQSSRFPRESIDALRAAGLLGIVVPTDRGGGSASLTEVAAVCRELGRHCGSSAMVFAMHQIQVACLVRHGAGVDHFEATMRRIAERGSLFASATTEATTGGDIGRSTCAVVPDGHGGFSLTKDASVISYGADVDDVLVTARAHPDAPPTDQVIVHTTRPTLELRPTESTWDAFGMRGTQSVGFQLHATGSMSQVIPEPYADVLARTMVPWAHLTWGSLWLGIAEDAVDRSRRYVRQLARKSPGVTPPSARKLAEVYAELLAVRAIIDKTLELYESTKADPVSARSFTTSLAMNSVKVYVSTRTRAIAESCLQLCGLGAYRNDSEISLTRHVRDLFSAPMMIHNDRLIDWGATTLCAMKDL